MTVLIRKPATRRALLRGTFGGAAISVGLPFLDCFLNYSGRALAAGAALPVRFGTWFWGLGHTPGHGVVEKSASGPGIAFLDEAKALQVHADIINYFGNFNVPLDGRSNYTHFSGWVGSRTGTAPGNGDEVPTTTYDLLIADVIGNRTRFKTIDLSATGRSDDSYSARNTHSRAAAEVSAIAFYQRMFGPEFVDPNSADFTPDPKIMLRKSVLSAVADEAKALNAKVGASDRVQLDQYFTGLRELEGQLALQLEKPAPNEACLVPAKPGDAKVEQTVAGATIDAVNASHQALTKLLAMAVACNQTHVFNMVYSASFSALRRAGSTTNHHSLSHEEARDPKLGIQPETSYFTARSMDALAEFIQAFKDIREGDGTLLDNMLIVAGSETSYARVHSIDNIPTMTVGRAGGRIKTGIHVAGNGDPLTRVGLTAMKVMGVPVERWGTKSLQTSKAIGEIVA